MIIVDYFGKIIVYVWIEILYLLENNKFCIGSENI